MIAHLSVIGAPLRFHIQHDQPARHPGLETLSTAAAACSWPHVPRLKKQSIFDLDRCSFNATAALGGEDHQLDGVLPRTTLLYLFGLFEDEGPRVRERA